MLERDILMESQSAKLEAGISRSYPVTQLGSTIPFGWPTLGLWWLPAVLCKPSGLVGCCAWNTRANIYESPRTHLYSTLMSSPSPDLYLLTLTPITQQITVLAALAAQCSKWKSIECLSGITPALFFIWKDSDWHLWYLRERTMFQYQVLSHRKQHIVSPSIHYVVCSMFCIEDRSVLACKQGLFLMTHLLMVKPNDM